MSEEQPKQEEQQQTQPQVEPCGGPLVCVNCAMRYAQAYFQSGKGLWADYYYRHAIKLRNEEMIGKLQEENKQLTLQNAELEKNMWKSHTASNGVS